MADAPPQPPAGAGSEGADPNELMRSRAFVGVLAIAAIVGIVASVAAWLFLEAVHQVQVGAYESLPDALGLDPVPDWWSLPVLLVASVIVAFAIARLPGDGGHIPANGLNAAPTDPVALPGVILAAIAGIGLGIVLGPEAPLIALGGGIGIFVVRRMAREAPEALTTLIASSGLFAAVSFLFGSPLVASVLLIEAAGLDKRRLTVVLIPGLLAAGIGSLVATGIGSWTGVDMKDLTIAPLQLDSFPRPTFIDFVWTVPLAAAVALGTIPVFKIGKRVNAFAEERPFVVLPAVAVVISLLAIGFDLITDKGAEQVLFSGETALAPLVSDGATWSVGALIALILIKGLAYGLALGSFRGGPVFPALFLGAAAGIIASHLPGFDLTPAIAVGMGAAVAAVLRLPLTGVLLAVVLTSTAGLGTSALIIVGVVVAFLIVNAVSPQPAEADPQAPPQPDPAPG